jgi:hypothetical protein
MAALVGLGTIAIALQYVDPKKWCCILASIPALQGCLKSVPGYLLSGLMISMGSSFWFDILARVTNLRSEGVRPA